MPWIIGGAMLVGGYMSSRSSARSQRDANAANIAQSNNAIAWEDYWRRTEVQTRMADLKAAGLNPLLAATQGQGASVPNAAQANIQPVEGVGEGLGKSMTSAVSTAMAMKSMQADTALKNAAARKTDAEASVVEATVPYSATNAKFQSESIRESFDKLAHEVHNLELEEKKRNFDLSEYQPLVAEYQKLLNQAERLGLSEKAATSKFYETVPEGKWAQIIKQLLIGSGSVFKR